MFSCNSVSEAIVYTCEDGGDNGAWVWAGTPGNEPKDPEGNSYVDENSGILNDIICNSDPLVLNQASYEQEGLEILCVETGAGQVDASDAAAPTVPAQNNCLLRCDWYPVLQFYTKGGDGWFYKYMDENEESQLDSGNVETVIRCWA